MDINLGNGRESARTIYTKDLTRTSTPSTTSAANARTVSPTELAKQTENLRVPGSVRFRRDEGLGLVDEGIE
jgi:hypothetical protein